MLPKRLRFWLFDKLSVKTMRYVTATPTRKATGLTAGVYDQIREDFFINGSLSARSPVPELLAAIWTAGRESILVDGVLDRTTKEAMVGVASYANDCAYCADMLVSLTHAGGEHDAASAMLDARLGDISDPRLRAQLGWVDAALRPGTSALPAWPFPAGAEPEVLGSLLAIADINRFSHVVMDGSPVNAGRIQGLALRWFGGELRSTKQRPLQAGRSLSLLPAAELPSDLAWAAPQPVIAAALARWAGAVERETAGLISPEVEACVDRSLAEWNGEWMPIVPVWAETDVAGLDGIDRAIARLAIVLAKSSSLVTEEMVLPLLEGGQERFVRRLAWASARGSRRVTALLAERLGILEGAAAAA